MVQNNVRSFLDRWRSRKRRFGVDFTERKGDEARNGKTVSVWPVLLRTYWKNFVSIFLLGLAHYSLTFVNPQASARGSLWSYYMQ